MFHHKNKCWEDEKKEEEEEEEEEEEKKETGKTYSQTSLQ